MCRKLDEKYLKTNVRHSERGGRGKGKPSCALPLARLNITKCVSCNK